MDDVRVGRALRTIRHHLGWRQEDVAARARVSQPRVSVIERGHLDSVPLRRIRAVARALDADVVVTVRWRGGDLDRLLDEGHATLVGRVVEMLSSLGWRAEPEVTYSVYGERGSIDILAWHEGSRTLLVIEVKTELASIEETLRRHDAKVRLARDIAEERFGWRPASIGRMLVLPNAATPRRRVGRHAAVLDRAYGVRGDALRQWLARPAGAVAGLLFVSLTRRPNGGRRPIAPKRVQRPHPPRLGVSKSCHR